MICLLDANAVRDLMDEHPQLAANVAAITSVDSVAVCSIVRGEVLFGIERLSPGKRRETLRNKAENLFTSLGEEPVPYSAGTAYAGLKRGRELAGRTMDEND